MTYTSTYFHPDTRCNIYDLVADRYKSNYAAVEKGMRYAICSAYKNDPDRFMGELSRIHPCPIDGMPEPLFLVCVVARDIAVETIMSF